MIDLVSKLDLSAILKFPKQFVGEAGKVVRVTALGIKAEMIDEIEHGPKSGRIYERGQHQVNFTTRAGAAVSFTARRGSKAKYHQASAPGEAPATDTGALVNSISMEMVGPVTTVDSVSAECARSLEFGSPSGRVAPRPFVRPAVAKARKPFRDGMAKVAKAAVKASGGQA
jgi:hypothetical protein